jgi:uncharacterized membrane protein YraQ (UPF0718 family)
MSRALPVIGSTAAPAARAPHHPTRHRLTLIAAWVASWLVGYALLHPAARWITAGLLGLSPATRFGMAVEFFLADTAKVLLLLVAVVFAVGVVRSFVTPARARQLLAGRREGVGNVIAAGLGVATPFCSCSAVPLFIGFVQSGVPLGVTLSFLIAAPLVNEVALALLGATFGIRIAGLYLLTGLAIAVGAGWTIGRLRVERWVEPWVRDQSVAPGALPRRGDWSDRVDAGTAAVRSIVGRVWPYVVAAIAIGAFIHGYVPTDAMGHLLGRHTWWSVPAAVVVGVPLYANAAGVIPVLQALIEKGVPIGTALAFIMAVVALSFPEMVILRRVLRLPLIATFVGVVAAGILLVGYLFNFLIR